MGWHRVALDYTCRHLQSTGRDYSRATPHCLRRTRHARERWRDTASAGKSNDIFVSELCQIRPQTPIKDRELRGHSDAHRCCGKSLGGECVGACRRASARAAGIYFQACAIDHSAISPFRINHLRIPDRAKSDLCPGLCPNPVGVSTHSNRLWAITGLIRRGGAKSPGIVSVGSDVSSSRARP